MRTYWRTVLGISLTIAVLTQIAVALFQGFLLDDDKLNAVLDNDRATFSDFSDALGAAATGAVVITVIDYLARLIATALLTIVISRAVLGQPVSISDAWRSARPRLLRLAVLSLLLLFGFAAIITLGGLPGWALGLPWLAAIGVLVALGIVIRLLFRYSLAAPALMLEKQGIFAALLRSAKLVRGSWWRIFGIQLLALILVSVVASVISLPFAVIAALFDSGGAAGFLGASGGTGWTVLIISGIGAVIGSTITFPIVSGVTVLLYIDQRIRREGLDLELARAAGLSGYGTANGPVRGN
jgi:hypothetical protein